MNDKDKKNTALPGPTYIKVPLDGSNKGAVRYRLSALLAWANKSAIGETCKINLPTVEDKFLNEKEAAQFLGLSVAWLRRKRWEAGKGNLNNRSKT